MNIQTCLAEAWKTLALSWKPVLRTLWPYLLLAGLTDAFVVELVQQYVCGHLVPYQLFIESDGDGKIAKLMLEPSVLFMVCAVIALLLSAFTGLAFLAKTFGTVRSYRKGLELPSERATILSKADLRTMLHAALAIVIAAMVCLVLCSPFAFVAFKWCKWVALPIPLIALFFTSGGYVLTLRYALWQDSLKQSCAEALKRAFGKPFILLVLTTIPVYIVCQMLETPSAIYLMSRIAATQSQLVGDAAGMAGWLSALCFVLNALCFALMCLAKCFRIWAMGLNTKTGNA